MCVRCLRLLVAFTFAFVFVVAFKFAVAVAFAVACAFSVAFGFMVLYVLILYVMVLWLYGFIVFMVSWFQKIPNSHFMLSGGY